MGVHIIIDKPRSRVMVQPIVLERTKKSNKKKSSKSRMRDADRAERHLYIAAQRTVSATEKGLRRYKKDRRASARRERDGAIIEFIPNVASGMVVGATHLAPLPLDFIRAMPVRRMTRSSLRATTLILDRP